MFAFPDDFSLDTQLQDGEKKSGEDINYYQEREVERGQERATERDRDRREGQGKERFHRTWR
jgi:hypothetical protein